MNTTNLRYTTYAVRYLIFTKGGWGPSAVKEREFKTKAAFEKWMETAEDKVSGFHEILSVSYPQ